MAAGLTEAEALVDPDRPLVESGDIQDDLPRREARAPELEPGARELLAEAASDELGPEPEPVLELAALEFEVVEADKAAVLVAHGKVTLGILHRLPVAVVEVVRRLVPPARANSRKKHASPSSILTGPGPV
jgi:hypothetical protein